MGHLSFFSLSEQESLLQYHWQVATQLLLACSNDRELIATQVVPACFWKFWSLANSFVCRLKPSFWLYSLVPVLSSGDQPIWSAPLP